MRHKPPNFKKKCTLSAMASAALGKQCPEPSSAHVLTDHNNNFRTGANLRETCLTWDNMDTIQKKFALKVDGQV